MHISEQITRLRPELIRRRRALHRLAEPSRMEKATCKYILNELSKMGADDVEVLYDTGVKAVFRTSDAQKTIAFRADIDALPVYEENPAIDYNSEHIGFMHACGHDGHVAIALTLAQLVSQNRDKLACNVVLLFQPAEETDGGAEHMIARGALYNPKVDEIYALHLWPYLPKHKLGIQAGPVMAHMCDLNVNIRGKGAHGARPQLGVDALVAAAQFIEQVQTILSRNIDPYQEAVITLGVISGGEARNIVCDFVHIEGTIRSLDPEVTACMKRRLHEILKGIEAGMGVQTEYGESMSYPAVINPPALVEAVRALVDSEDIAGADGSMASEDFSYFQHHVPGLYIWLGTCDEQYSEPLHSNKFNFDEDVMLTGLELYARILGLSDHA